MRSSWSSERRSSFSPLAWKVSSNQLIRSRAGFSARVAPSSSGPKTEATARCIECSGPPSLSENWVESKTKAATTRSTRIARRLLTCLRYTAPAAAYPEPIRPRRCEFLLIRWMASNSSSERPEPTATQVSGDSVNWAGIWHSSRRR